MSLSFAETTIDGVKYETRAWDPFHVLQHGSAILSEVLAPAVANLSASPAQGDAATALIIAEVVKNFNKPAVQEAIKNLFPYASADGIELKARAQIHFLGKSKAMVEFISWGLGVQLADFFIGFVAQARDALSKAGSLIATNTK